jgi:DNA repair protein RecO (recombination protein O)
MPLRESEAIILQSYPLGEGDRLISFLSRREGRIRGVAAGARKPKTKFGSTLEPLSYIRIWFFERETRELVRITQSELIESFMALYSDYPTSVVLALFCEITEGVLPDREPSDPAFRLLLLVTQSIKKTGRTVLPLAYFALWSVRLGGWLPSLKACAKCRRELGVGPAYFTVAHLGLTCEKCRAPGMRALSPAALTAARKIEVEKLESLSETSIPPRAGAEVTSYMLDIIEHQLEKKLKTRSMLESNA